MTVEVVLGDILNDKSQTLVNTVNCVGVMGKGIALEFKKRYPAMFEDYKKRCRKGEVEHGVPYHYEDIFGNSIINFPTKDHWRSASRIDDIVNGLDIFINHYKSWNVTSVAFPPLGCGNGGLLWEDVGPLMYRKLSFIDIPVRIYAPYSTPEDHMTCEYLSESMNYNENITGDILRTKITPEKVLLLEVLFRLEKMKYASPVGRTIFQKICYMLTQTGVDLNISFRQGTYGPFSDGARDLIKEFSNCNLITEKKTGSMINIRTGSEFPVVKEQFKEEIRAGDDKIEMVVDLFSRIRSTEQAGEVTTVFYVYSELKSRRPFGKISEEMIFDRVIEWKNYWADEEKLKSVADAVRILTVLRWISVEFSDNLPVSEIV